MVTYAATCVDPRWWKMEYRAKGNVEESVILSVLVDSHHNERLNNKLTTHLVSLGVSPFFCFSATVLPL